MSPCVKLLSLSYPLHIFNISRKKKVPPEGDSPAYFRHLSQAEVNHPLKVPMLISA